MARSDIFEAIRKNSLRQMKLLLESGSDVDVRNGNSETPLMVALWQLRNREQREQAVAQLLEAGADVNARNAQGRTPLLFACSLDQVGSVRILLQTKAIDVNQGDISGVTPLMLSAALGHRGTVSTLMEFARAGHVQLNLQAKDDSEFTALDYAQGSGHAGLADHIRGRSKTAPTPVKLSGNKLNNNTAKKRNMNNGNLQARRNSGPKSNTSAITNRAQVVRGGVGGGGGGEEEIEMAEITPAALRDSNLPAIQQFGREMKDLQAQSDTNFSASFGSSSSSSSRPGSRLTSSASSKGRSGSQERVGSRAGSRLGSSSKDRVSGNSSNRVSSRSRGSLTASEDDDDLDLDLSSLRELMGTVREAAKEIREIVKPMQQEKEQQKACRQREHKQKRSSHPKKDQGKHGGARRSSGHSQQIKAEIHVISEINGRSIPPLPPPMPTPLIATAPPLEETPSPPPTAFLHVENEELSRTWPRQKGRSVSRERSLSERSYNKPAAGGGGGASSEGSSPMAPPKYGGGGGGGAGGADSQRISPTAAKSERDILEKVVGRQHSGPDPLVAAINNANPTPKSRLIMESRQRVVGRARDHWSSTHPPPPPAPSSGTSQPQTQPLPHITVSEHDNSSGVGDSSSPSPHPHPYPRRSHSYDPPRSPVAPETPSSFNRSHSDEPQHTPAAMDVAPATHEGGDRGVEGVGAPRSPSQTAQSPRHPSTNQPSDSSPTHRDAAGTMPKSSPRAGGVDARPGQSKPAAATSPGKGAPASRGGPAGAKQAPRPAGGSSSPRKDQNQGKAGFRRNAP